MNVGYKTSFSRREIASKVGVTAQNVVDLLGDRTEYTNAEAVKVSEVKAIADEKRISFSKAIQEYKAQEVEASDPQPQYQPQPQAANPNPGNDFANPFQAESIDNLGLEFDQNLSQLMQAAGAQQHEHALAMREFETVMRLLNEAALDKATEDRYLAIARGVIEPSPESPLEQWFLKAYQAIQGKKSPYASSQMMWQGGKMVLRLQPQRSSVCPLQVAAAAAQNGGTLPSLVSQLPQLPSQLGVKPVTAIPANLHFLLPSES